MLVGMFKTLRYTTRDQNEILKGLKNRRNVVLSQMAKYEFIDETLKDSLQQLPLGTQLFSRITSRRDRDLF